MISIQTLEPGTRVKLAGGIIAEVRDNPRDGSWLVVRYLEVPSGTPSVSDEMAHADEVIEVL